MESGAGPLSGERGIFGDTLRHTLDDGPPRKMTPIVPLASYGRRGIARLLGALVLATAHTAGAQVPAPLPPGLAAATFDSAWTRVRDTYYDPAMRGVDWDGVRDELRPRASSAESVTDLREVLADMLSRLGESHFSVIPGPSSAAYDLPASPAGDSEPGLDLRVIGDELVVSRVRPGSPAEAEGVRPGWVLDAIDNLSMDTLAAWARDGAPEGGVERYVALWLPISARARLTGPEGSRVALRFRDESDRDRALVLVRAAPTGAVVQLGNLPTLRMETTHRIEPLPGGGEAGVIRLSAWFPAIVPALTSAMGDFRAADGIVMDLRGNPGGLAALVMGVGGHFLDEPLSLGEMRMREATLRFVVNPQRVLTDGTRIQPFEGPFAILVDALTASTSEVFAGGMQALGRARVFGEPTAGQALPALVYPLPNGDRLLHAVADFTASNGARLEGAGVTPDVLVPLTREALLAGDDASLQEALRWIASSPN